MAAAAAAKHGVKTLGVVGAGQMGLGIAYVAAVRAQVPRVMLCDASPAQLEKGVAFFDKLLAKDVSKGKLKQEDADAAKARLVSIDGIPAFKGSDGVPDMVIEAATENLSIKQKIFSSLASTLPLETILGTNTSSISITKIAAAALPEGAKPGSKEATESPKRVLGIHWMNPVPVLKLVELIPALQTSQDVIDRSRAFAEACGKTVTFSQDTPGFIANRLLMPYINEAIIVLESGIASKEDIDTTMKLGMAHPMGALELADHIGLDTCYAIMETLYRETSDSKYRPSVLLGRMVDAGWYGKKNGKGFYDYSR